MMDLATMREREEEAAREAEENRTEPAECEATLLNLWKEGKVPSPIKGVPMIGDYVPPGWREAPLAEPDGAAYGIHGGRFFVDTSGFRGDGEPALTQAEFFGRLEPGYGYALVETSQFQGYVARFERVQTMKYACPTCGESYIYVSVAITYAIMRDGRAEMPDPEDVPDMDMLDASKVEARCDNWGGRYNQDQETNACPDQDVWHPLTHFEVKE